MSITTANLGSSGFAGAAGWAWPGGTDLNTTGIADVDYSFGDPGDQPFVGDFDGDGTKTVGLHRPTTGLVYFRNSHTTGIADHQFTHGQPPWLPIAGTLGL